MDADDPQKVINFMIKNVGKVRYNGPETVGSPALTDSRLYLVWAVQSYGGAWHGYMGPSKWHLYKRGCCDKTVVFY